MQLASQRPRSSIAESAAISNFLGAQGDQPCIFDSQSWITYAQLSERVLELSSRIRAAANGNKVVVALNPERNLSTVVAMLAVWVSGNALLPIGDCGEEIADVFEPELRISPDGEVVVGQGSGRADREPIAIHEELALLLSTSGTTGSPKLVRLSHENLLSNSNAIIASLGLGPDDCAITSLPLDYCYGMSVVLSHLRAGGRVAITDLSVTEECFWQVFEDSRTTTLSCVPHSLELLERSGFAQRGLPSLRRITQAGGRCAPERVSAWHSLSDGRPWDFYVMYGQTEATSRIACMPPNLGRLQPDAAGLPVQGQVEVVDGELAVRGPHVMLGYATTRDDLRLGRTVHELRTGDKAEIMPDGAIRILGRETREVKLFGLRVDLDRIEAALEGAIVVQDSGGISVVVEADSGSAENTYLLDRLEARVAELSGLPIFAIKARSIETLPRSVRGKVDRARIAAWCEQQPRRACPCSGAELVCSLACALVPRDLESRIREAYARALGLPGATVRCEQSFTDLGGDSLSYVYLSVQLHKILGEQPPQGWHLMPMSELLLGGREEQRRFVGCDTSIVLRALAILAVVASHIGLIDIRGGAHLLLALAGVSFARFVVSRGHSKQRLESGFASLKSLAVPSAIWLGLVIALSSEYSVRTLGVTFSGLSAQAPEWRYWFIEVLALLIVAFTALTAIPAVRRATIEHPVLTPGVALAALLAVRTLVEVSDRTDTFTVWSCAWLFSLGWLIERLSPVSRWLATLAILVSVPGFFDLQRTALILGALLLLVWMPRVPLPAPTVRMVTGVAAASLFIYLSHWQVYPAFHAPVLGLAASVACGVGLSALYARSMALLSRRHEGAA